MPRNPYFSLGSKSEKNLYEDIVIEGLKIYGHDVYYLPRKIINQDGIFNEATLSEFGDSFVIESYIENVDGFEGEGDLLSKFGLEIRDQATLVISNRRWSQLVGRFLEDTTQVRPNEGDLIYIPFVNTLFEIQYVEEETPFYQLQNLPVFKLKIEAFEYSNEAIDTGVEAIDQFEETFGSRTRINVSSIVGTHIKGDEIQQTRTDLSPNTIIKGEIAEFVNDTTWDIVGINAADGSDNSFIAGSIVNNNTTPAATAVISNPSTQTPIDENDRSAQNEEFDTVGDNFIDFSELNPFGDPREP
tara:strand:+ start:25471 stop:26373 length:903 start_codon:yes stop_codon:yes gene_type:complete